LEQLHWNAALAANINQETRTSCTLDSQKTNRSSIA
jgi:hypothetical protein